MKKYITKNKIEYTHNGLKIHILNSILSYDSPKTLYQIWYGVNIDKKFVEPIIKELVDDGSIVQTEMSKRVGYVKVDKCPLQELLRPKSILKQFKIKGRKVHKLGYK